MRGDGRIFRRGRIWWIAYSKSGHEYRESSRTADEKVARQMLRKRLATPTADSVTVRELASRQGILEQLTDHDIRALYVDCLAALRRLRKRLSAMAGTRS